MKFSQNDVIKVATDELGYLEKNKGQNLDCKTPGGSGNYTKYWAKMKPSFQGSAWCQCFINWCFTEAYGEANAKKLLCTPGEWSYYTPTSAQYFKDKKQWYTKDPQPGDIVYFKNSTRIHHVGQVIKVSGNTFTTIEGNTGCTNNTVEPNGGGVFSKTYLTSNCNIAGFGRPAYSEAKSNIVETPLSCGRAGLRVVGATTLNIRKFPVDGASVGCAKCGDLLQCTAKAKGSDGTYWFKCDKGYVSGKYLEGWINECNKWWYVEKGYTYPKGVVKEIDGKQYCFDMNGWMIDSSDIDSSGALKNR